MTSMTTRTSRTHLGTTISTATSTTSCNTVSIHFTQRPSTKTETTEHKTLNNTLVKRNEVLTRIWKLSQDYAPFIHKTVTHQDKQIILYEGSTLEL